MIYAKVQTYNGNQQTIAARSDQPDTSWAPYNVADATWLYISNGAIAVHTQAEMDAIAATKAHAQLVQDAISLGTKLEQNSMPRISRAVNLGKTTWQTADVQAFLTALDAIWAIARETDTTSTAIPAYTYPANT